jgi:peptidoglycan/xylan/chitin deacetylase (PgdA/CDA1 family)
MGNSPGWVSHQPPRSAILAYHSLDTSRSVISIAPEIFRRQMECLAGNGVPVVPLATVQKVPGSVALTFDDAYRNLCEHALPELARHGFPATVFVVAGHCGGWNDWDQKGYQGIPRLPLMDWPELREMAAAGVELGGHSVRHPDLTALPPDRVRREMQACRDEIEQKTGQPARTFAYPYGLVTPPVRRIAAEYYEAACGTELRFVAPGDNPHELPRLDVYYLQDPRRFEEVVTGGGAAYIAFRRTLRRLRRIL